MKNQRNKLLVFIVGPTAIGKTALSIALARHFNTSIVSADSRQFFRELSIGTAKPTIEEQGEIPHYLVDSHSIEDEVNAWEFEQEVLKLTTDLFKENQVIFVTGGSGLYLHAIWHGMDDEIPPSDPVLRTKLNQLFQDQGIEALRNRLAELDPEALNSIDVNNHVRLIRAIEVNELTHQTSAKLRKGKAKARPFEMLKIGLDIARHKLHERINQRVDHMIELGLEAEAKSLLPYRNKNALQTVGYRELFQYFDGLCSREEAIEKIKINTRRYAKRQMTWFRRYNDILWHRPDEFETVKNLIQDKLNTLK